MILMYIWTGATVLILVCAALRAKNRRAHPPTRVVNPWCATYTEKRD